MKFIEHLVIFFLNIALIFVYSYIGISMIAQGGFDMTEWSDAHKVGFAVIYCITWAVDSISKEHDEK